MNGLEPATGQERFDAFSGTLGTVGLTESEPSQVAPFAHWAYQVDTPFRPVHELVEMASSAIRTPVATQEADSLSGRQLREELRPEPEAPFGLRHEVDEGPAAAGQGLEGEAPAVLDRFREAMNRGLWAVAIRIAISRGEHDENKLTNMVFVSRHPELGGRRIRSDERTLAADWLRIRDQVVRPAIRDFAGLVRSPAVSAAGPLAIVATPLPAGKTASRYGIPETIEALAWIGAEWSRRYPDVQFAVNDISKLGGGRLSGHRSHRVGLDADVILKVQGRRIDSRSPDYERHRSLVQALVDLIRDNKILPVKTIGFLGPNVRNVRPWKGHEDHLHVRFCRPAHRAAELDLNRVYSDVEEKPSYDGCSAGELEVGDLDLYYEFEDEDDLPAGVAGYSPGVQLTAAVEA